MRIEVAGLEPGKEIPVRYTGDGENVSPRVTWRNVPAGAKELALIVEDPDAPTPRPFVHWVACHIPAEAGGLPERVPAKQRVEAPTRLEQGRNDFGNVGYGGPAPPRGHGVHHYHFRLFALDSRVEVPAGGSAEDLKRAMRGHVVAEAECVGTYAR